MVKDKEIAEIRKDIDRIDERILELLNKRASLAIEAGKMKVKEKMEFYAPEREREIYEKLTKKNRGPLSNQSLKNIFREIISASLSLEKLLTVAFLGPMATFTHLACIKHFGLSAEFISKKDIADVFDDVERGKADYGVVPIENTTEGVVSHTLDMFMTSDLKVYAEKLMEVSLVLLNKSGRLNDILKIYSHPHALAECREWLKNNMSNIPAFDVSSTAMAAKLVAEDPSSAAIASESAAEFYDLKIAERNIQDHLNNYTRFLIIGKTISERSGTDKTSIMFTVKDSPGILCKMLEPFAKRGINLTKVESRPQKNRAWEYVFFIDIDGYITDPDLSEALKELDKLCIFMKVLGSYPKDMGE
jgi:chorismate mutase/prephenate dehydratase